MKRRPNQKSKRVTEQIRDTHQPEVFETTLQKTNIRLKQISELLLSANISPSEVEKLRGIFPPHVREIWPEAEQTTDLSDHV